LQLLKDDFMGQCSIDIASLLTQPDGTRQVCVSHKGASTIQCNRTQSINQSIGLNQEHTCTVASRVGKRDQVSGSITISVAYWKPDCINQREILDSTRNNNNNDNGSTSTNGNAADSRCTHANGLSTMPTPLRSASRLRSDLPDIAESTDDGDSLLGSLSESLFVPQRGIQLHDNDNSSRNNNNSNDNDNGTDNSSVSKDANGAEQASDLVESTITVSTIGIAGSIEESTSRLLASTITQSSIISESSLSLMVSLSLSLCLCLSQQLHDRHWYQSTWPNNSTALSLCRVYCRTSTMQHVLVMRNALRSISIVELMPMPYRLLVRAPCL
jgi:hypothetical protein